MESVQKKFTAPIWQFAVEDASGDVAWPPKCALCNQQYGAKTNASNLMRHVHRAHPEEYAAFSKGFDAKNQKELNLLQSDG